MSTNINLPGTVNDIEPANLLVATPFGKPLPVPCFEQEGDRLCWAASAEMVLHFCKFIDVKQCQLADLKLNEVNFCCTLPKDSFILHCDHGVDEDEVVPVYQTDPFHITAQFVNGALEFNALKEELYGKQRPVQVGILWKSSDPAKKSGHMVIVCGCYVDAAGIQWVYVNDPLIKGQVEPGRVRYQDFRNNYKNSVAGPGEWVCSWVGLSK
jgi:hypothetical protein